MYKAGISERCEAIFDRDKRMVCITHLSEVRFLLFGSLYAMLPGLKVYQSMHPSKPFSVVPLVHTSMCACAHELVCIQVLFGASRASNHYFSSADVMENLFL